MNQEKRSLVDAVLLLLVGAAMVVDLFLIFLYAPVEKTMGPIQKIFYFHVPSAWVAFLAFFVTFIASIAFLATRKEMCDRVASSSAAIGTLFCTIVMITGPIWGKPVWGIWWTWDPRLTSTMVLWFIFVGYILIRSYLPAAGSKRAALSAVVGIFGFLNVPLVYMSIRWWRTQHPQPVIAGGEGSGLDPRMKLTFFFSLFVFTLLYYLLIRLRVRLASLQARGDQLMEERRIR